jgi:hypothetical protein
MTADDSDVYQATWELVELAPLKKTGRNDGKSPRSFIDVDAFRRLVKRGFDGRPKDVRDADREEVE